MKNKALISMLALWATTLSAQDYVDLVKFDYAITPLNTFDSDRSAKTTLREINGNITFPLVVNERTTLLTGINYENITASFNPGRAEESLTGVTLKLGVNKNFNTKWSGTFMLLPRISSDLEKLSKRDFQFGGIALMKYVKKPNLNYTFGLYGNSDFFGPFIVPLFGCYYLSPTHRFEANLLLPLSVDLNYRTSPNFRWGLTFDGLIRSYNINTPIANETDRYLVKSARDVYTYCQYKMKNGIHIQLGVGRSVGRTYLMYNEKVSLGMPLVYFGDDRKELNSGFADGWLFKTRVFYRFDIKKDTDRENTTNPKK